MMVGDAGAQTRHEHEVMPGVTLALEVDDDFEGTVEPRYAQDDAAVCDFVEVFNRTDDGPLAARVELLQNTPLEDYYDE